MKKLTIAGATVNQTPFDWYNNRQNSISAIQQAKEQKVDLLCFPELSITGYGCEDLFLSEWLPETAWKETISLLPETDGITVCVGLPFLVDHTVYNGVCVMRDRMVQGISLKQNLARDGVHYEPRWFKPWPSEEITEVTKDGFRFSAGDLIFDLQGIRFGFEICEDAWGSVRPGKKLFEKNIDLILNPSASHFTLGKSLQREKIVTDSSQKFNCAYLYVNLLGNEAGRMIYDGDIILSCKGKLISLNERFSFRPFNLITTTLDFENLEKIPEGNLTDNKETNEELTRATCLGLYDYLRKSRSKGFVLSLSGGADSATCAILVAEMVKRGCKELGNTAFITRSGISSLSGELLKNILTCAYQSTTNSSDTTLHAAKTLALSIGVRFMEWSVQDEVNSYTSKIEEATGRKLNWKEDDIALQNIQARARSPIIWMLANINKSILLTTSNRSEADVGYATMDGDTSGSLAPIAGITKPMIIKWLRWAEKELGYDALKYINSQPPTAELRPAANMQTDENDLMPYDLLVSIENQAIFLKRSPIETYEKLKSEYPETELKAHIKKFFRLWSANQWKRERLAPSFHLDELNVDPRTWCRFPILSGSFGRELEDLDNM